MPIASLYAALLTLIYLGLSVRTLRLRHRLRIAIGDGANLLMLRAMRVHANFAEYVPLGLLLMVLVEHSRAPAWFTHALGLALVVGRVAHAVGVSRLDERLTFRVFGMAMTFTPMALAALWLLKFWTMARGI